MHSAGTGTLDVDDRDHSCLDPSTFDPDAAGDQAQRNANATASSAGGGLGSGIGSGIDSGIDSESDRDRVSAPDLDLAEIGSRVVATVLADGEASRLQRRLVHGGADGAGLVTDVSASNGLMGGPFDDRDPDTFTITAVHPAEISADRVTAAVDEELDRLAEQGPGTEELAAVLTGDAPAFSIAKAAAQLGWRPSRSWRTELVPAPAH